MSNARDARVDRIIARTGVDRKNGIGFHTTTDGGFILYEPSKGLTLDGRIVGVEADGDDTFFVGGGRTMYHSFLDEDTAVSVLNKAVSRYKFRHLRAARNLAGAGLGLFMLFKACTGDANSAPLEDPTPDDDNSGFHLLDENAGEAPDNFPDYTAE